MQTCDKNNKKNNKKKTEGQILTHAASRMSKKVRLHSVADTSNNDRLQNL